MRHWLSTVKQLPIDRPETFSHLNADGTSCEEKLSAAIIEAVLQQGIEPRYSKATDSPVLLQLINPTIVSSKCPLFREMFTYLTQFCSNQA